MRWEDVVPLEVALHQYEWELVQKASRMIRAGLTRDQIQGQLRVDWAQASGLTFRWWNRISPVERYLAQTVEVQILAVWLKLKYKEEQDVETD